MSLFIHEYPLTVKKNNSLVKLSIFLWLGKSITSSSFDIIPLVLPLLHSTSVDSFENQISKAFDSYVFNSVDFRPKINLRDDEKIYYIHSDLPGMSKNQIKMDSQIMIVF